MKYLEGEEITLEELEGLLGTAIRDRVFVPVFAASAVKEEGIISLLNAIVAWFPTMADFGRIPLINGKELDISPDDDRPVAFVFKSLNDTTGKLSFLKVLAGTKYGEILGVHILAPSATELIEEAALAIKLEATLEEFTGTIHCHPTVAEAVREAGLAADKKAIHIPNRK